MTRKNLPAKSLEHYRDQTYRRKSTLRLRTVQGAIEFVEQRGFVTLWPIKDIELPSLWAAVAGERPVASEHDDPGHITWGWKDQMLDQRCWYYGKLLRGKATFVSLDVLPKFYLLSPREADLDDYRQVYRAGVLSHDALRIADALLDHGAMDSIKLRKKSGLSSPASKYRFDRGLTELQKGLWILPIGVAEAGSWRYAFIYELLDRWYPELSTQAGYLKRPDARQELISLYFLSVGAAGFSDLRKVFGWGKAALRDALERLSAVGELIDLGDDRWATRQIFSKEK